MTPMVYRRPNGIARPSPDSGSERQDDDCVMVELDLLARDMGIEPGMRPQNSTARQDTSNEDVDIDDDGDTYVDDLYQEYKASVAASSNKKARYRFRRRMRTLLCIASVVGGLSIMIVLIKKATYVPPTMAPTVAPTSNPTRVPTLQPTEAPSKAPVPYTNMPTTGQVRTAITGAVELGRTYFVHERAATQIGNYRLGSALIINIHITHHAGTSLCAAIGMATSVGAGKTPSFVCWKPNDNKIPGNYPYDYPWSSDSTSRNVDIIRSVFHFIAWEFRHAPNRIAIKDTDWEDQNLVSILIIRHPINRLLSADGIMTREYPNIFNYGNATTGEWWNFARAEYTNNYALRILAGADTTRSYRIDKDKWCCNGSNTNPIHLDAAKALIRRFTFVLDIDCLQQGIEAVANLLNITSIGKYRMGGQKHGNQTIKERINNSDIYDYLVQKNRLDIELYEWAKKTRTLIDCSKV